MHFVLQLCVHLFVLMMGNALVQTLVSALVPGMGAPANCVSFLSSDLITYK